MAYNPIQFEQGISLPEFLHVGDRGRDADCSAPPAQIRTCPIKAYGSYLGS